VERETEVARKRVEDAETAIKQKQEDMSNVEKAGLATRKPEKTIDISKMYFSLWKPPGVSESMGSANLDASISGEYQTLGGHSCRPSE